MLNSKNERELAYFVKVDAIEPISGSDNCECADIGGWRIMVRKSTFKAGDLAIYFEVDSKVDTSRPEFAFLAKRNGKIKTQKYTFGGKGLMYSQGLLMSPNDFVDESGRIPAWLASRNVILTNGGDIFEGDTRFLTKELGVIYADTEDNSRKASKPNKYQVMAQRNPKLFKSPIVKKIMRYKIGRKVMFFFFGKKKDNKKTSFPVGKFPGVSITDQERCLVGATFVLTDKGRIKISNIVNNKLDVKVASMNEDGSLSYKKILDYQKFSNRDNLITISYPYSPETVRTNSICCTPDHKIYTTRGYVEAQYLTCDDKVYMSVNSFDQDSLAPIYGMLLGDSHIYSDKRSQGKLRIIGSNGEKQLDYLKYKYSLYENGKIIRWKACGYENGLDGYHWFLDVDSYLSQEVRKDWYTTGKKVVSQKVIDKLDNTSLAFWYMDDGCLSYRNPQHTRYFIRLNTQSFSYEENQMLSDMLLNKFGVKSKVNKDKISKAGERLWRIDISSTEEVDKFAELIAPYVCDSMLYKLPPKFQKRTFQQLHFYKNWRVMAIPIVKIEPGQCKYKLISKQPQYVYDLEIEDNHNFIAENIVVHNCENLPHILEDKTPFIVTQKCDGSSGTYILERKSKHKYEFYVCSRRIRLLTPQQQCFYDDKNYYWEVAQKYDIENKMKDYLEKNPDISFVCWQGEICAPGIQKNPHHLNETHFYAFHFTDSKNGRYDIRDAEKIWKSYGIEVVPIVNDNYIMPDNFEEFKSTADGTYEPSVCEGETNCHREGFVYYKTTDPTFSFKNVSREYLLKH